MSNLFDKNFKESVIFRINKLTPENKAQWGRMNANQMVCHCTDQLRIALGELTDAPDTSSFMSRTLIKFMVLHVLDIPKNVPTSERVNQVDGDGTKPTDFESDRQTLLSYIEKFDSQAADFVWTPHFKFGKLSGKQWAVLAQKHLNHHLKQFGV